MCGITGIFAYTPDAPPVDTNGLTRIRDHMTARGPDGAGLWVAEEDKRLGLGHRRLAILDPHPRGDQPMWSEDGRYGIVYNGEIYNFRELASALARTGCRFHTGTDTEVLIELYRRDGTALCGSLRGMYAFGIWDTHEETLFLARDPFGIKPLYVHDDGHTLRFASQVKALLAGGGIVTRPEPAGLAGFWVWGHVPEPWTCYQGIQSLAPGSWLRLERNGRRQTGRFHDLFDLMCGQNTWLVARAAARTGLKVALSGLGGDELFGGYPSFKHVPRMHALTRPLAPFPAIGRAVRRLSVPALRRFTSVKYGGLFEYGGTWEGAYLLRRAERMPWELAALPRSLPLADPDLLREGLKRLRAAWVEDRALGPLGTDRRKVSYLELTRYMRDRLLRDADWAGMAHSLEIRVPLVDPRVLLAAMRPATQAQATPLPALGKQHLAACAQPPLPPHLLYRPKSGFSVPVRDRLLRAGDAAAAQRGLRGWQERVARAVVTETPGRQPARDQADRPTRANPT